LNEATFELGEEGFDHNRAGSNNQPKEMVVMKLKQAVAKKGATIPTMAVAKKGATMPTMAKLKPRAWKL
jgi:hypothetical protein